MNSMLKENVQSQEIWLRLLYMVIFSTMIFGILIANCVFGLLQWFVVLWTNQPNQKIICLSERLNAFALYALQFITYVNDKPHPSDALD
jgi:Domain of unknown function (DUF4389)